MSSRYCYITKGHVFSRHWRCYVQTFGSLQHYWIIYMQYHQCDESNHHSYIMKNKTFLHFHAIVRRTHLIFFLFTDHAREELLRGVLDQRVVHVLPRWVGVVR